MSRATYKNGTIKYELHDTDDFVPEEVGEAIYCSPMLKSYSMTPRLIGDINKTPSTADSVYTTVKAGYLANNGPLRIQKSGCPLIKLHAQTALCKPAGSSRRIIYRASLASVCNEVQSSDRMAIPSAYCLISFMLFSHFSMKSLKYKKSLGG